jgi:hypothetical protein
MAMKLFTGWAVSAGLVVAASVANAQMPAPTDIGKGHYQAASDVEGPSPYVRGPSPYAGGVPPEAPATRYGPALLPPLEVYAVVRENGFSPLGIPHQRGYVYLIAVVDRAGQDGRLIIDARNGQIIRFLPTFRTGGYYGEDYRSPYGPAEPGPYGAPGRGPYGAEGPGRYGEEGPGPYGAAGPGPHRAAGPGPYGAAGPGPYGAVGRGADASLPPTTIVRGAPRPPASIPRVASRTVPVPSPKPLDLAAKPAREPIQQSAAVQAKPADTPAPSPAAAPTVVQAKPAPTIQPTQEMPKVQGLE